MDSDVKMFLSALLSMVIIITVFMFAVLSLLWFMNNIFEEEQCEELKSEGYDVFINNTGFWKRGKICMVRHLGESFDVDKNTIIDTIELIELNDAYRDNGE
jgi:hypothetical protein